MAYDRIISDSPKGIKFREELQPGDGYITITKGLSGNFAVHIWLNDEEENRGPFLEPYNSGIGRYPTEIQAAEEAVMWADEEDIPCILTDALWNELILKELITV